MINYLPVRTDDSHATFAESGWTAHDFKAWLKTESDDDEITLDVLVEATFVYDSDRAVGEARRRVPPLDFRLDFNQYNLVPIRFGLGPARVAGDSVLPFRFELSLYDVDFELEADKMVLSAHSLGFSSGTDYERNAADEVFDDRKVLPVETVYRMLDRCALDAYLDTACYWKAEPYDDDAAAVRVVVEGVVSSAAKLADNSRRPSGASPVDGQMNLVLDLRGPGGIPFGHQTVKFFPVVAVDDDGSLLGEPFLFHVEHDFEMPIEMVAQASLTATVYGM